jgi:hypothetical protein
MAIADILRFSFGGHGGGNALQVLRLLALPRLGTACGLSARVHVIAMPGKPGNHSIGCQRDHVGFSLKDRLNALVVSCGTPTMQVPMPGPHKMKRHILVMSAPCYKAQAAEEAATPTDQLLAGRCCASQDLLRVRLCRPC